MNKATKLAFSMWGELEAAVVTQFASQPKTIPNGYRWTIQLMDSAQTYGEASDVLQALKCQDGFISGTVLHPSPQYPEWRIQAFFKDEPEACGWLPDGLRRCLTPQRMLQA